MIVSLVGAQAERDVYRTGAPSLEGRAMFANAKPTEPSAAIISRDLPDAKANIAELVRQHFIVKTRADADIVEPRANDRDPRRGRARQRRADHPDRLPGRPTP